MNPNHNAQDDKPLRKVLREWTVEAALPPRFQQQVWQRIECAQPITELSFLGAFAHWIGVVLPRPTHSFSYLAILLVFGMTLGWSQARYDSARVHDELGQRYLLVLDP